MNTPDNTHGVTTLILTAYNIRGMDNCDDCSLTFDTPRPRHGRVTLVCFQTAWTAYWTNLADEETAVARFMSESVESLVRSFQFGTPKIQLSDRSKESGYLQHMIDQVRKQLRAAGIE